PRVARLRLADEIVGFGHRLDSVLRLLDRVFGHRDGDGVVLAVVKLGVDAGGPEDLLDLLGFGDVPGHRDSHHLGHCGADDTTSCSRRRNAPPLTRCGIPRSANGTSTTSKSRGTTVSVKIARASSAISGPKYRFERWVSASRPTLARCATSAACVAVWCLVSAARSRSSSENVASVMSTSAPHAASTISSDGAVSPVITTFRPARDGPSTSSGLT